MYHKPQRKWVDRPKTLEEAITMDKESQDLWYKRWLEAKEEFQRKEAEAGEKQK